MAKTTVKQPAKESKTVSRKPTTRSAPSERIEKVAEEALTKLRELNIEHGLQSDIEWCIGSYRADKNPVGLYEVAERALTVLKTEKEKKTKGITSKLISDIEKALQSRS